VARGCREGGRLGRRGRRWLDSGGKRGGEHKGVPRRRADSSKGMCRAGDSREGGRRGCGEGRGRAEGERPAARQSRGRGPPRALRVPARGGGGRGRAARRPRGRGPPRGRRVLAARWPQGRGAPRGRCPLGARRGPPCRREEGEGEGKGRWRREGAAGDRPWRGGGGWRGGVGAAAAGGRT
jgi:hypothetical protein